MARGFRMGVGGGGSLKPNPIIISGSTINYNHDSTLVLGRTDSMYFEYPNTPFIHDLDMTKFNTLSIVSRNTYGNGSRLYFDISGSPQDYRSYTSANWQTFTIDISNMTGLHSIKLTDNADSRIYINSMVMS